MTDKIHAIDGTHGFSLEIVDDDPSFQPGHITRCNKGQWAVYCQAMADLDAGAVALDENTAEVSPGAGAIILTSVLQGQYMFVLANSADPTIPGQGTGGGSVAPLTWTEDGF